MISIRRAVVLSTAGAVAMAAAACGSSSNSDGSGTQSGGTFAAALWADPGKLDPHQTTLAVANFLFSWAYDTVVSVDTDGTVVPLLASSWDVTPTSVTYHMRNDVTCSDGSKVTPSVVAQNFTYISDPANKSPLSGILVPAGLTAKADDAAGTVTITSPEPDGFLLLVGANTFIVCGKGLADRSLLAKGTSGSGLFQLTEAVSNDHYSFDLRKEYAWGPKGMKASEPGVPSKLNLKVVASESTAVNLIAGGQLNAAQALGPDRERLAKLPGVKTSTVASGPGQYFFNQAADRPGHDLAVRKALASAVNIDELEKIAGGGTGVSSTGLVSIDPKPCTGDTVKGNRPAYDVDGAKKALDAAGWVAGADGVRARGGKKLRMRFMYSTASVGGKAAVEYIAGEWQKIGVTVEIKGVPPTQQSETLLKTGEWEAAWVPIAVALPSQIIGFLSGPTPPNGTNFAHIANAEYTRLVGEAIGQPGEAGCKLWNQAEAALFTNVDMVPVVNNTAAIGLRGATALVVSGGIVPHSVRMQG